MAVSRVTQHHQGAGVPTDIPSGDSDPYSYWVGPTRWTRLQSPYTSTATKGHNRTSVDLCISADRTNIPVTDREIAMIGECVADARSRGEVVDHPNVFPHRESYGTACPGNQTMVRFGFIIAACQAPAPIPQSTLDVLVKLNNWRLRVTATPLEFGDEGHDIRVLVDALRSKGFLGPDVRGDKYGWVLRRGVYRFKMRLGGKFAAQATPNRGARFGGPAADALLGLG